MKKIDTPKIKSFAKRNGITSLYVFGSYARGTAGPKSDIDLIVKFRTPQSIIDLVRLENELSGLLKTKVDLLTEDSVSPYLKDEIHKDMKKIV